MTPFLQIFGAAAACVEELQVDLDRSSSIDGFSSTSGKTLSPVRSTIAFENVTFHYPSRPTVDILQDVSIHFPPGKHTAIVGLLGSGKSTIGALIAKLYDPNQGKIILDGHDIQDLNVRRLRSYIGVVRQDSWLLNRSILEEFAHGLVSSLSGAHGDYEATLLGPSLSDLVEAVRGGQEFHRVVAAQRLTVTNIVDLVRETVTLDGFIGSLEH